MLRAKAIATNAVFEKSATVAIVLYNHAPSITMPTILGIDEDVYHLELIIHPTCMDTQ